MKKYNPNTTNPEIHKGANIAFLKDFLATTSVDELVNMEVADINHLETLLADSIKDELRFEKYFPLVAFAAYYNEYGHAIHRDRSKKHRKSSDIDWTDHTVVAENRRYVRNKLIPSCRRKICDMLNGRAYWQTEPDIPQEKANALKALLSSVTPAVV